MKIKKLEIPKYFLVGALVSVLSAIFYIGNFLYFEIIYENKFYPNTKIAGISVSGKTFKEAKELVIAKTQEWNDGNTKITGHQKEWEIKNSDFNIQFEIEPPILEAYGYGRDSQKNITSYINNSYQRLFMLFSKRDYPLVVAEDEIEDSLKEIAAEANIKGVNMGLKVDGGKILETEEVSGRELREEVLHKDIKDNAKNLSQKVVSVSYTYFYPNTDKEKISQLKKEAEKFLNSSLIIKDGSRQWSIGPSNIGKWLVFSNKNEPLVKIDSEKYKVFNYIAHIFKKNGLMNFVKEELEVSLDSVELSSYLSEIAKEIDKDPVNAKLSFVDDKLVIVTPAQTGRELNVDNAVFQIADAIRKGEEELILPVKTINAQVRADNIGELGIKELISQGKSDFSGSSSARIHNIKIGASKFDGVLVAPGEEFSFNKYLGPVDASGGFLPELVIKPGKLVKEYGGGLCQVATTAFRAILYSGAPVTERKNHSFAVSYYFWPFSTAGTDATIYPPHPDLRFKNDTGHYILIQTYTQGNRLFFDFYGTAGNTKATLEGPFVLSRTSDGYMTTVLYRNVYEGDTLKRKDTFKSYYKPASQFERVD